MLSRGLNSLLTLRMKVYPAHFALYLIEANIVEPFKAGPRNSSHPMVGDQEVLLPPHEYVLALTGVCDIHRALSRMFLVWPESAEFRPVT
jgi:hypothetical protein